MAISTNQSDVARIRQQIEAEFQAAAQARHSFSQTAKHAFITARMERLNDHRERLTALVGDAEAMRIICEATNIDPVPRTKG